jgi:hypothetical protein
MNGAMLTKNDGLPAGLRGTDSPTLVSAFKRATLYETWSMEEASGGLFLLYGHSCVLTLSQRLACRCLQKTESLLVLDGANTFNPYLIAELARKAGREAEDFLRSIRVSRSFTCHQMLSLILQVERAVHRWSSPLVLFLGPFTAFYDESVPGYESQKLFHSFQQELSRLNSLGIRCLLACQQPVAKTRRNFVQQMKQLVLGCASCWPVENDGGRKAEHSETWMLIQVEKPAASLRQWLVRRGEIFTPRPYLPF